VLRGASALRWLLVLGLSGTVVELLLLDHDEGPLQLVPIVLLAASLVSVAWTYRRPTVPRCLLLRALMVLLIGAGSIGVVVHFRASMEFQREVAPSLGWGQLARKAIRAKAPPALAPGVLVQLGLLGLVASRRPHDDLREPRDLH
jgi:hypothetical protein